MYLFESVFGTPQQKNEWQEKNTTPKWKKQSPNFVCAEQGQCTARLKGLA